MDSSVIASCEPAAGRGMSVFILLSLTKNLGATTKEKTLHTVTCRQTI